MNKRQVIVLWIIAVILAASVAVIKFTSSQANAVATERMPGATLFEAFPAAQVTSIRIAGADGEITVKKDQDSWVVVERDNYPARTSMVIEFLRTLAEVEVTRAIEAGPSFAARFGMDPDAKSSGDRGLTATFTDASGTQLAMVSFGKNVDNGSDSGLTGGPMTVGRYVRDHADESGFYAVSELFPALSTTASAWLDPSFFSPEKISGVSLTEPGGEKLSWKLVRESEEAEFKLEAAAPGEVLDTTAVAPLKSLFSYARFEDVMPAEDAKSKFNQSVVRKAVIETFEGFRYTIMMSPIEGETEQMVITVDVTADIPDARKKADGESEEDSKAKDEAFASRAKSLREKLSKESAFMGRHFIVSRATMESLMKERANLVKQADIPEPGQGAPASVNQLPGGAVATPPIQVGPAPGSPGP